MGDERLAPTRRIPVNASVLPKTKCKMPALANDASADDDRVVNPRNSPEMTSVRPNRIIPASKEMGTGLYDSPVLATPLRIQTLLSAKAKVEIKASESPNNAYPHLLSHRL